MIKRVAKLLNKRPIVWKLIVAETLRKPGEQKKAAMAQRSRLLGRGRNAHDPPGARSITLKKGTASSSPTSITDFFNPGVGGLPKTITIKSLAEDETGVPSKKKTSHAKPKGDNAKNDKQVTNEQESQQTQLFGSFLKKVQSTFQSSSISAKPTKKIEGYTGDVNEKGQRHGYGVYVSGSGTRYEGAFIWM